MYLMTCWVQILYKYNFNILKFISFVKQVKVKVEVAHRPGQGQCTYVYPTANYPSLAAKNEKYGETVLQYFFN